MCSRDLDKRSFGARLPTWKIVGVTKGEVLRGSSVTSSRIHLFTLSMSIVPLIQDDQSAIHNYLTGLFEDPNSSPYCGRILLAVSSIGIITAEKTDAKNLRKSHNFFNHVLRFLVVPRTDEQIQQLLDTLGQCSCHMTNQMQQYHRLGARMEQDMFERSYAKEDQPTNALILSFFCLIEYAMTHSKSKAVAQRTTETWPGCPEDLMPWGADALIRSLRQWMRFTSDLVVLRSTAHIYTLCGALVQESIIKNNFVTHAIDAGRALFDRVAGALRDGSALRIPHLGQAFEKQVECLVFFFENFVSGLRMHIRPAVVVGYEIKAVQMFSLLAYLASDPRLTIRAREWVIYHTCMEGSLMYGLSQVSVSLLPDVEVFPRMYNVMSDYPDEADAVDQTTFESGMDLDI